MKLSAELKILLKDSGSCFKCGCSIRILDYEEQETREQSFSIFKCQCDECGAFGLYQLKELPAGEKILVYVGIPS